MLLAALPWTYWLALPLLAGTLAVLAGFALVYLKKVVEPYVLYMDYLNYLAASRATSGYAQPGGQRAAAAPGGGATQIPRAQTSGGPQ